MSSCSIHALIMSATPLVLGGCTINASPIHAELSETEMRSRVLGDFFLGMDAREVRDKVRSLDLDYRFETETAPPCESCGPSGFVARVMKPGPQFDLFGQSAAHGELWLWLDGKSHLVFALYKGHGVRWEFIP